MNTPTPGETLDSPMIGVPSRTDSDETGSEEGNKYKDDLFLFTKGRVHEKSGRRSCAPPFVHLPYAKPWHLETPSTILHELLRLSV